MQYTLRPFNPLIRYPNQVKTELEKANDNFEIIFDFAIKGNRSFKSKTSYFPISETSSALGSDGNIYLFGGVQAELVGGGVRYYTIDKIYKFQEDGSLIEVGTLPIRGRCFSLFTIGNKIYVGGGDRSLYGNGNFYGPYLYGNESFYSFDVSTHTIERIANAPFPINGYVKTFSAGGFGYIVYPRRVNEHQCFLNFYRYEPALNTWSFYDAISLPKPPTVLFLENLNIGVVSVDRFVYIFYPVGEPPYLSFLFYLLLKYDLDTKSYELTPAFFNFGPIRYGCGFYKKLNSLYIISHDYFHLLSLDTFFQYSEFFQYHITPRGASSYPWFHNNSVCLNDKIYYFHPNFSYSVIVNFKV